jgi:phosphonoacetaldehyde hydrolase
MPRYRGPLQGIILDWAGTTIDYGSRAPVIAVIEAFRAADVHVTLEEARAPMGRAKRDHLATILEMPQVRHRWQQVHRRPPQEGDVDRVYERFLPLQNEVIARHAQLIPGCCEAIDACRRRGLRIGSSTGYTRPLMDVLLPLARGQGYEPEAVVTASDVSPGRPAPWMCFENARQLGVYPMEALVKVDDTTVGIAAGLNASMWTIGIAQSGNLVGLSEDELAALEPDDRAHRVEQARQQLLAAGAHYVIDTIADLLPTLEAIERQLAEGQRP